MATTGDIELQRDPLERGAGRGQASTTKRDEHEAAGYGDTSNKIWKLYGAESEKHDKALVDSWMGNTDSMLIFTYKTLTPGSGSQTAAPSAVRVNLFMFLSLFFSVTSALISTLIQQWAREYLQYSQPSAAPHKRGRVRAYLFDGLSRFQMTRLTYGVPVLLHLAVFLFFYALSELLYSVNVPVGATARYCLVALLAVYMALSVLPLIVRNAPYQTALTTPLYACISLIQASYVGLRQLVQRSYRMYEGQKLSGLFKSIHVDRTRALMKEIKRRASELDRSAMHWLLQELDEDDMDTFLGGLPGYLYSPLTDKKVVVEGLVEDGVPGRIREHITTCLTSVELSQEESMSRASACINSLQLISETAANSAVRQPGSESDDIQAIMEYLEPLCFNSSTALRALCIRGLAIREFLKPLANLDAEELQTKKFPDYLMPLYRVIRVWKTTEISQWSRLTGNLIDTSDPLPSDQEMWADVVYDGPLINLAVLAYGVLSRASEGDINLDMAWKTFETLLKSLGLVQVQVSAPARCRFNEVFLKARGGVSGYEGGVTKITPLLETLDIVTRGLRLGKAFAYIPKPMLLPRQIEAIFGPEQLRNSELLEAFASHLPGLVRSRPPEESKSFMEILILEDKLWEQLHFSFLKCFDPKFPFPDKLRIVMAFEVLKESSIIDWRSPDLDLLYGHLLNFEQKVAPGKFIRRVVHFRSLLFVGQFCHSLLSQFSVARSRGGPLMMQFFNSLTRLVWLLGVGTQEDRAYLTHDLSNPSNPRTGLDMMIKADAILTPTLRNGPLSNFCMLGRLAFDSMVSDGSDLTLDDTKKLWQVLGRMLDTPRLPLADASAETWVRFDHLQALVRDPALLGGNSQTVENLRPLLDMIEKVERIRPPDGSTEGTGGVDNQIRTDSSVDREILPRGRPPMPGSSRQVEASHPGTGGPMDPRLFPPVPGTIPLAGMGQFASHGWTPPDQSHLDPTVATEFPSPSIPITLPGPGTEIAYPLHAPQVHHLNFWPPFPPGMSGPRRAATLDSANLQAQERMQSMLTTFPAPPSHMIPHPHPFPPPSFDPLGGPPPDHVNDGNPVPMCWTGGLPTPDAKAKDNPSGE